MSRRRAVITGIGPITCIGKGLEEFWNGIRAEKSGISRVSTFDTTAFNAHSGGEILGLESGPARPRAFGPDASLHANN